jgi:hypothetical protein
MANAIGHWPLDVGTVDGGARSAANGQWAMSDERRAMRARHLRPPLRFLSGVSLISGLDSVY